MKNNITLVTAMMLITASIHSIAQAAAVVEPQQQLFQAVRSGDYLSIAPLKAAGADVNMEDNDGSTALIWAARKGHVKCISALIVARADVNRPNKNGDVALSWAARKGHIDCVLILIDANTEVNHVGFGGSTALMKAAAAGHIEPVRALIKAGSFVNQTNNNKNTALMYAASNGHLECVHALIRAKADVNQTDITGRTALIKAVEGGRLECVRALIRAGADVNIATIICGATALTLAAEMGHQAICETIVERLLYMPNNDQINSVNALLSCLHNKPGFCHNIRALIDRSFRDNEIYWDNRKNFGQSVAGQAIAALPMGAIKIALQAKYATAP